MQSSSHISRSRRLARGFTGIVLMLSLWMTVAVAQPPHSVAVTIQGSVLDAANKPVAGASVLIEQEGNPAVTTKTNLQGAFVLSVPPGGSYRLTAEKSGSRSPVMTVAASIDAQPRHIDLVLRDPSASGNPAASGEAMEFADQPNFTVAGVTDWTAVGGHGSDAILRTSESLARETLALTPDGSVPAATSSYGSTSAPPSASEIKLRATLSAAPESFEANHQLGEFYLRTGRYRESISPLGAAYKIDPSNQGNEYDLAVAYQKNGNFSEARDHVRKMMAHGESADLHRLSGELDEQVGDPLAAVHEYEQAVRLDPSEQNYFEWGSELLLHRAVWQAQEVFGKGAAAYPKSARMLTGQGTALFAGALYDQAALHLCDASDLNPADPTPYLFLGKIEMVSPAPLPCVEPKLARFAEQRPENALANYYYAMALWKRQSTAVSQQVSQQVEALLTRAVTVDPKCGDAYLQLGVIDFTRHDLPGAISFYQKAIEANPQLGEAYYRLGVAYDRTGEPAKAREQFQIHDELEKSQAEDIERQRREVKQFLVVLQGQPAAPQAH